MPSLGGLAGAMQAIGERYREQHLMDMQDRKSQQDRLLDMLKDISTNPGYDTATQDQARQGLYQFTTTPLEKWDSKKAVKFMQDLHGGYTQNELGRVTRQAAAPAQPGATVPMPPMGGGAVPLLAPMTLNVPQPTSAPGFTGPLQALAQAQTGPPPELAPQGPPEGTMLPTATLPGAQAPGPETPGAMRPMYDPMRAFTLKAAGEQITGQAANQNELQKLRMLGPEQQQQVLAAKKGTIDFLEKEGGLDRDRATLAAFGVPLDPKITVTPDGTVIDTRKGQIIYQSPVYKEISPGGTLASITQGPGGPVASIVASGGPKPTTPEQENHNAVVRMIAEKAGVKLDETKPLMPQLAPGLQAKAVKAIKEAETSPSLEASRNFLMQFRAMQLKDMQDARDTDTIDFYKNQVRTGAIRLDQVPNNKGLQTRVAKAFAESGEVPPVAMSPSFQTALSTVEPVLTQIERLKSELEPIKTINKPGYFLPDRLKYAVGISGTTGGMLADLSLSSIVGAARVLKGSSRAYQIFEQALVHTPNAWKDSPQLIYDKLGKMERNLKDGKVALIQDGAKSGVIGAPEVGIPPKAGLTPPNPPAPGGTRPRAVNPTTGEAVEWDGKAWVPAPTR